MDCRGHYTGRTPPRSAIRTGSKTSRCAVFSNKDENGRRRSDTDETTLPLSPGPLLAVSSINGIVIAPGEHFSFCRLVGRPTRKRGHVEGMELSFGEARSGSGICQLSNLIHWMAIHSTLVVVERSNHSFDPFPDEGRVLPFGSGAAIFYNYVDLVLHNPTDRHFQLKLNVGKQQLEGELLCDRVREFRYHVYQVGHRFLREGGRVFRENEIWREVRSKGQGSEVLENERLYRNRVVVKYEVEARLLAVNG